MVLWDGVHKVKKRKLYSRKQWTVGWFRNDGMLLAENGSSSLVILVTIKRRVKVFCSTYFSWYYSYFSSSGGR